MDDQDGRGDRSRAASSSSGPLPLTWQLADLPPATASVSAARHRAHDTLTTWGEQRPLREDDALLLLDELAANAVQHARTPFAITLSLDDAALRGAVHDDNPHPPLLREPTMDGLGGRGIYMVAALADRWGVDRHPGDGKTVWFEINTRR